MKDIQEVMKDRHTHTKKNEQNLGNTAGLGPSYEISRVVQWSPPMLEWKEMNRADWVNVSGPTAVSLYASKIVNTSVVPGSINIF